MENQRNRQNYGELNLSMDQMLQMDFDQLQQSLHFPVFGHQGMHGLPFSYHIVDDGMNMNQNYESLTALDENRVKRGVKPDVLQNYKKRIGSRGNKEGGKQECGVCMEEVAGGQTITELPCKHSYCTKCIQQWLKDNDTCPICRWKFPTNQTQLVGLNSR
eukprot:TRINITY_DN3338_c0_g2_i1.p2 TRINITY_DN3338_c0_g2~~TRINITY_DN3338_c0_g2_i1.p2  ORF type:complete len:160 (-),score=12.02 TRINITY_DN3338_c0_g2_i1:356-835(-)